MVAAFIGAAVLSSASVAQADAPGQRGHVGATLAGSSAADVEPDSCADKNAGNYPYPGDDTKMVSCSNHHAYERDCPQGQHFDSEAGECD